MNLQELSLYLQEFINKSGTTRDLADTKALVLNVRFPFLNRLRLSPQLSRLRPKSNLNISSGLRLNQHSAEHLIPHVTAEITFCRAGLFSERREPAERAVGRGAWRLSSEEPAARVLSAGTPASVNPQLRHQGPTRLHGGFSSVGLTKAKPIPCNLPLVG